MCYLVAKDRNAHGCFALKTTHGKHLVELKRELNREVGYKGVQLVTISRPTAYGEYAPYHFVDGTMKFVMINSDRNSDKPTKADYFDRDFNWLDFTWGYAHAEIRPEKPEKFEEMFFFSRKAIKGTSSYTS